MSLSTIANGLLGIVLILFIAFLFSNNKRKIKWRLVVTGLLIQVVFAIFILHGETMRAWFFMLGWPKDIIDWLGTAIVKLLAFTIEGAKFVFGNLAVSAGDGSLGFFFAFQVLPTIIFFASLTTVLYYLGVLQAVVRGMAWVMARLMGTSGAESLSNTANIFLGQTEAPLLIRPFIGTMTRSEILTVMVGGMATVAGGVMASFVQMLGTAMADAKGVPLDQAQLEFAVHLIAASAMAAPASLVISKILYPETGVPKTLGTVRLKVEKTASNIIEAAANGAADGVKLAINVGAMLIAFIAFIALVNFLFLEVGGFLGVNEWLTERYGLPLSMELIFGFVLKYLAMGIGVPAEDAFTFGTLFGTKVVLNEFVAYIGLVDVIKEGAMSSKGILMSTFALCGFANFSSIAIQIGGIGPMAPERKKDLASLGLRAVLGGSLVTLLTATLAGILVG
jgi:CNT family concentrative nucleoside transporter